LETDSEIWIGFPNGIGPSDKNQKEKKRKTPGGHDQYTSQNITD
jgi:hypothetical protein